MDRVALSAITFIIDKLEGGDKVTDDPDDPGGLTKYGISQRAYPNLDIRNLTRPDAEELYYRDYWLKYHCDELPDAIAFVLFDGVVNQDAGAIIKLLQKVLYVPEDGKIGPATITAAKIARIRKLEVVKEFLGWRLKRYATRDQVRVKKYMRGWSNRILDVMEHAVEVAYGLA